MLTSSRMWEIRDQYNNVVIVRRAGVDGTPVVRVQMGDEIVQAAPKYARQIAAAMLQCADDIGAPLE